MCRPLSLVPGTMARILTVAVLSISVAFVTIQQSSTVAEQIAPSATPAADFLPPLDMPTDAQVLRRDRGSDGQSLQVTLATALSGADLESYFARHLQAIGWNRTAGAPDASLAWSMWDVPGRSPRRGALVVLEWPESDRRTLYLQVEATGVETAASRENHRERFPPPPLPVPTDRRPPVRPLVPVAITDPPPTPGALPGERDR